MLLQIQTQNGIKENLDFNKIRLFINDLSHGLENINVEQIIKLVKQQIFDHISTRQILDILIKITSNMISVTNPDVQYLASRILMRKIRLSAYGSKHPSHIFAHVKHMIVMKQYDSRLLEWYDEDDFEYMEQHINHNLDDKFAYAGAFQLSNKYLLINRTEECSYYESPQMMFMMVAATLFHTYPRSTRLDYVIRFYHAISNFKISLPTPILASTRTGRFQLSSCVLLDVDDTLKSIGNTVQAILRYISNRAGIGVNFGRIRAVNSPIKKGHHFHSGSLPFIKLFQAAIKSCSQGGVRQGAGTFFYPIWHLEVESFLVLKNNRGSEDNRARHIDYGIQINKLFYSRLIQGKDITLLNSYEVPGLYEAFFRDQELFQQLYEAAEQNPNLTKKTIAASELFSSIAIERSQTGRLYIQNVDHCNEFSSFNETAPSIKGSNLCMEITLPTSPVGDLETEHNFEIALCTLAAINLGRIESLDELEELADLIVRALDNVIETQEYPIQAAKIANQRRRPIGVGVTNFAYYLAKNGCKYDDGSANNLTHITFEALQYALLKASNTLAKEYGPCQGFKETKYSQGIMPPDNYKKYTDMLHTQQLQCDWDSLRHDIMLHGLRNSTLSAIMPCESSSIISNSTNGIEPPRGFISVKQNKDGTCKQLLEDIKNLKDNYQLLWSIKDNRGYLNLCAIMQKFIDQSISTNTNYDPFKHAEGKVPLSIIIEDVLYAYKIGLKTLYYHNTRDQIDLNVQEDCGCSL